MLEDVHKRVYIGGFWWQRQSPPNFDLPPPFPHNHPSSPCHPVAMQMFTDLLRSFLPNLSLEGVGHVSVGLISCGTLLYSWHVLRPQPPGWTRLLSATPVVLANVAGDLRYHTACSM
eukprot:1526185-Rhodomonas_salina.3